MMQQVKLISGVFENNLFFGERLNVW